MLQRIWGIGLSNLHQITLPESNDLLAPANMSWRGQRPFVGGGSLNRRAPNHVRLIEL
jgi:hypothetical protein